MYFFALTPSLSANVNRDVKTWWGVAGICFFAFIAITIISGQIYEHVPHSEDEVAYVFQAKVFALNRLAVPTPPQSDAFWTPFVADYEGQRFSIKYPIGWSLLLSLGYRLRSPWFINTLLGTLTLALIAWFGHHAYCNGSDYEVSVCYVPLIAAGLGLVTPGFLFLSSSLLAHTASLFWAALALVGLTCLATTPNRYARRRIIYAILVGGCLGGVFVIRPFDAFGVAAAVSVFLLALVIRSELNWTVLLWTGLSGILVSALLPLYWWLVVGNPVFNPYSLVWPYDRIGFGPDVGPKGYYLYDAIFINTWLKMTALVTGLFGWPGWSNLLFLLVPFLSRRANRWDWLLLGTILGTIVVYMFYWSFGGVDGGFPRYYYDALPAFLLLTTRGILMLGQLLGRWVSPKLRWLPILLIIGLIGYNLVWHLPPLLVAQKGRYDITSTPLRVVAQAELSEPALILVKGYDSWHDFAVPFIANSPILDGPIIYAIDWGPGYTQHLRTHFANRSCWELWEETLRPCPAVKWIKNDTIYGERNNATH